MSEMSLVLNSVGDKASSPDKLIGIRKISSDRADIHNAAFPHNHPIAFVTEIFVEQRH